MKDSTKTAAPKPMDDSIRELAVGGAATNNKRNAYALVQLVSEVRDLFPETLYEFSNYDGRNTALDVTFDAYDEPDLQRLLALVKADPRVDDVLIADGQVLVMIRPGLRTQDSRDSFRLAEAWEILATDEEGSL